MLKKVLFLQGRKSGSKSERRQRLNRHRLLTKTEVKDNGLLGILEVRRITPYDAGNYSCVPSYALPDWAQVHVMHGMTNLISPFLNVDIVYQYLSCASCYKLILSLHFIDEKQGNVIDGVSEVKIDASAAKKRGSEVTSDAISIDHIPKFCLIIAMILFISTLSPNLN